MRTAQLAEAQEPDRILCTQDGLPLGWAAEPRDLAPEDQTVTDHRNE
jgi:hypothetical protein